MPASQQHIRPDTPMGANLVAGGATFRTWAPNATAVCVVGDFNNFTVQGRAITSQTDTDATWSINAFVSNITFQ